jgi:hypothetical protein
MMRMILGLGVAPSITKMNVDELKWMVGTWKCEIWGGVFEETWLDPAGGTMQGVGRHLREGETVFMEFMSIEKDADGTLVMWMILGAPSRCERKLVAFRATRVDRNEVIWENVENEYPRVIHYGRSAADRMTCTLSQSGEDSQRRDVFDFARVK